MGQNCSRERLEATEGLEAVGNPPTNLLHHLATNLRIAHNEPMQTLVTNETVQDDAKPAHVGTLVMRICWADGRVTETICRDYGAAYDVIGGDALPFERWEILGVPEVRQTFVQWARRK